MVQATERDDKNSLHAVEKQRRPDSIKLDDSRIFSLLRIKSLSSSEKGLTSLGTEDRIVKFVFIELLILVS